MKLKGAQLFVEILKSEGIGHVFGVSGSVTLPILDVLYGESKIRYIQSQHEQNGMYMANGYARATKTAGVCLVSPGPGITNCVTPVAQAYYTSTPVVLVGVEYDAGSHGLGSALHHDLEAVPIFKPVTKLSFRIERVERLLPSLQMALRTALSGRKGPVYLGIARNILNEEVEIETLAPQRGKTEFAHPADPASIARAADLLMEAKRPVALAGGGVAWAQAEDVLLELAGHLGMPVAVTGHHKGLIPDDHPLALGIVCQHGPPVTMEMMRNADVLLAIGCTYNNFLGSRSFGYRIMDKGKRIIQVDIDPTEIGKVYQPEVGVLGDARSVVKDILREIRARKPDGRPVADFPRIEELARRKNEWQASLYDEKTMNKTPIQRIRLLHDLRQALPRDAVVVGESGGTNGWYEYAFEALTHNFGVGGWHPLGAEYPETLGVKVALPDRAVVCLTGDGSIMMTLQEIATAAMNNIDLLCVICRNGSFGNMRHTQLTKYAGRIIGTDLPACNLADVARDLGAYGERVETPDEIIPAIGRAMASGKPALLEVMIDNSLENLEPPSPAA